MMSIIGFQNLGRKILRIQMFEQCKYAGYPKGHQKYLNAPSTDPLENLKHFRHVHAGEIPSKCTGCLYLSGPNLRVAVNAAGYVNEDYVRDPAVGQ